MERRVEADRAALQCALFDPGVAKGDVLGSDHKLKSVLDPVFASLHPEFFQTLPDRLSNALFPAMLNRPGPPPPAINALHAVSAVG